MVQMIESHAVVFHVGNDVAADDPVMEIDIGPSPIDKPFVKSPAFFPYRSGYEDGAGSAQEIRKIDNPVIDMVSVFSDILIQFLDGWIRRMIAFGDMIPGCPEKGPIIGEAVNCTEGETMVQDAHGVEGDIIIGIGEKDIFPPGPPGCCIVGMHGRIAGIPVILRCRCRGNDDDPQERPGDIRQIGLIHHGLFAAPVAQHYFNLAFSAQHVDAVSQLVEAG